MRTIYKSYKYCIHSSYTAHNDTSTPDFTSMKTFPKWTIILPFLQIYWKNMDTASNTHWGSWSERKIFLPYLKLFFLQPLWPGAVVCSSLVWRNFLLKNIKWLKAQNKGLQNLSINFLENWLWPLAACWIWHTDNKSLSECSIKKVLLISKPW